MRQPPFVAIISAFLLATAACVATEPVEGSETATASIEADDATEPVGADEPSDLGYGWETPIRDKKLGKFTLSEIVTEKEVHIRIDGRTCVGCHSWAEYQDRVSFCDRVDSFLEMPTAKGDKTDKPSAKPAALKKLLRNWKEAGCPN